MPPRVWLRTGLVECRDGFRPDEPDVIPCASNDLAARPPRRLVVLGSTGSVGTNTLDVVAALPGRFEIVGLAARSRADRCSSRRRFRLAMGGNRGEDRDTGGLPAGIE